MREYSFFQVLKGSIECAFCKEKRCPMRYYPGHVLVNGTERYGCNRDFKKMLNNGLKRKPKRRKK